MKIASLGELPAVPLASLLCSSALVHGATPGRPAQMGHGIRLQIGSICKICLFIFSVSRIYSLLCSLGSCLYSCFLWVFSRFFDGSILFIISPSIWFYSMMTWVSFCGNCDVCLLEAWSQHLLCVLCCLSTTVTNNWNKNSKQTNKHEQKSKNFCQFESKIQSVFHKALNCRVLLPHFAPWIQNPGVQLTMSYY